MSYMSKKMIKKIILSLFGRLGLNISLKKSGYHYVPDYYGCSAHKHIDIRAIPEFSRLADGVIKSGKTYHYYDRLYTLYQALVNLQQRFKTSECFNAAEVGVYKGGTSYFLSALAQIIDIKAFSLHCFDTFEGHATEDIRENLDNTDVHKPKMFNDTDVEVVKAYLGKFSNVFLYKGRCQDTCVQVTSEQFHFVHVDMDLYEPIFFALDFFGSRLIEGGIMIVDDYGFTTCPGAKKAVDEFMANRHNYFGMHLLTGQYIIVKMA